ncbi:hypothetical protein DFQ27_009850, partial [Actinomortierella ambigua]
DSSDESKASDSDDPNSGAGAIGVPHRRATTVTSSGANVSIIGTSDIGSTYRARYINMHCVAKELIISRSQFRQMAIQEEVDLVQRLRHPHLLPYYEIHQQRGCIYLIIELADKGSLADAIRSQALSSWSAKFRLVDEIARGLEYLHYKDVLHGALKSTNVLLTKNMEVKLADFGLQAIRSAAAAAATNRSSTPSSPALVHSNLRWMAPELLDNTPRHSTKSDIYALGMVMWEMAASCTEPFKELTDNVTIMTHIKDGGREKLPGGTPNRYRALVERCLEEDAGDRPEAGEILFSEDDLRTDSTAVEGLRVEDGQDYRTSVGEGDASDFALDQYAFSSDPEALLSGTSEESNRPVATTQEITAAVSVLISGAVIAPGTFGNVIHGSFGKLNFAIRRVTAPQGVEVNDGRILWEIRSLRQLKHKNIIQLYHSTYLEKSLTLVMEYADGGSLKSAILRRQLDWPAKQGIVQGIVRALAYLHSHQILHQDLKSANVLLTGHLEVKLSDFGLANVRTMLAPEASGINMSPRWKAPELFYLPRVNYSTKSDMYALGMVLWEIAANSTQPFQDIESASEIGLRVVWGKREVIPQDAPTRYRSWILKCWKQNPTERPEARDLILSEDDPSDDLLSLGPSMDLSTIAGLAYDPSNLATPPTFPPDTSMQKSTKTQPPSTDLLPYTTAVQQSIVGDGGASESSSLPRSQPGLSDLTQHGQKNDTEAQFQQTEIYDSQVLAAFSSDGDNGSGLDSGWHGDVLDMVSAYSVEHACAPASSGSNSPPTKSLHSGMEELQALGGGSSAASASVPLLQNTCNYIDSSITPLTINGKPVRILLAESNSVNQAVVLAILRRLGYHNVDVAHNGLEVISKLDLGHVYDLILMDVSMPLMDGIEATKMIIERRRRDPIYAQTEAQLVSCSELAIDPKSEQAVAESSGEEAISKSHSSPSTTSEESRESALLQDHQDPYVIAMTASTIDTDKERCIEAGMDDVLTKPFSLSELRRVLSVFVERRVRGDLETRNDRQL